MASPCVGSFSLFPNSSGVFGLFIRIHAVRRLRGFSFFGLDFQSSWKVVRIYPWPWLCYRFDLDSRLWIINRGPDPNTDGLFVGKQAAISLSRQLGLMARHKYIKSGIAVVAPDPDFGPSRSAKVGTFGLSGPRSPVKSCCSASDMWKHRSSSHSSEVCVFEGSERTFDVSHQHYQCPQRESTPSSHREEVKIRRRPHLIQQR